MDELGGLLRVPGFPRANRHCVWLTHRVVSRPLRVGLVLSLVVVYRNLVVFMGLSLQVGRYQVLLLLPQAHCRWVHFGVYLAWSLVIQVLISLALVGPVRPVALPGGHPHLAHFALGVRLHYVRIVWFLLVLCPSIAWGLSLGLVYDFCLLIRGVYCLILAVVDALLSGL